jgi:hypothetical protein
MAMTERDAYLWDPAGPPDPEIERLERLLRRFEGPRREKPSPAGEPRLRPRPRRRPRWPWLVALAAAAGIAAAWLLGRGEPARFELPLTCVAEQTVLATDEWIEAAGEARELRLGDGIGRFTLEPGGRLQVRQLDRDQTRFYLAQGTLHAFVMPTARPRFFQVDTPSARCIDLGCKYELHVDPSTGAAFVRVTLGQVAFEEGGREVYVPRGAECTASRTRGAGTPRFSDSASAVKELLDRLDAERGADAELRGDLIDKLCAACTDVIDTLALWHLLAEEDAAARSRVERRLAELAGWPAEATASKSPGGLSAQVWREHLQIHWWR